MIDKLSDATNSDQQNMKAARHQRGSSIYFPALLWITQIFLTIAVIFLFSHVVSPGKYMSPDWLHMLAGWDGSWYTRIAQNGYTSIQSTAFFPGFPLAIHFVHAFTGLSYRTTAVCLANVAYFLALIVLYKLFVDYYGVNIGRKALWLMLVFPVGFFFQVAYTESFTLLASALFFYFLHKNRWYSAMVVGACAGSIHDLGVLLVLPALIHWGRKRKGMQAWRATTRLLSVVVMPSGLVAYLAFLYVKFGNPLEFLKGEAFWHRQPSIPVWNIFEQFYRLAISHATTQSEWNFTAVMLMNGLITLLFYVLGVLMVIDKTTSLEWKVFFIFTLLTSTVSVANNSLESFARFTMVIFPGYAIFGKVLKNEHAYLVTLVILLMLRVFFTGLFGDGYVIT
ncbi:hypothetical protein [Alicyclobacillus ferrooxydans]|uniref:Glycosyltransferase RgtA/B/C/D-like domain-containing protein n=1 Tax=Alicyclobacillus ferrooxydans TaxID=471514 RepID=A0A0P9CDW7_9BACL|nr:hypothetical protein [Alicyclobacillus ferrooxydans]KPV43792.1 hypothetical protein AN477_10440 [Alicyclobacillus ferrooxydans]